MVNARDLIPRIFFARMKAVLNKMRKLFII